MTIPDFELCYKDTGAKTVCYWQNNRYRDQWNKVEDVETSQVPTAI